MADLFDKLLVGINKGVSSVSSGSKFVLEKAKINTAISDLENEKKEIAELLGAKAYNLFKEGKLQNTEELGSFCNEIDKRIYAIQEQKKALERLEKLSDPIPTPPSSTTVQCSQCGAQNMNGSKFCSKCGFPLQ